MKAFTLSMDFRSSTKDLISGFEMRISAPTTSSVWHGRGRLVSMRVKFGLAVCRSLAFLPWCALYSVRYLSRWASRFFCGLRFFILLFSCSRLIFVVIFILLFILVLVVILITLRAWWPSLLIGVHRMAFFIIEHVQCAFCVRPVHTPIQSILGHMRVVLAEMNLRTGCLIETRLMESVFDEESLYWRSPPPGECYDIPGVAIPGFNYPPGMKIWLRWPV